MNDFDGRNLILIVGSPRSGTTWLQKLLAAHPLVKTGQESDVFDVYIGPQLRAWRRSFAGLGDASQQDIGMRPLEKSGRGGVGLGCYFSEKEFLRALKDYLGVLMLPMVGGLRQGEVFLEKTPGHALYLPEIVELLPRVRVVHILRDGRDVSASLLAASRTWGKGWAPKKIEVAARMWAKHVQAVRRARGVIPDGQFYEVRYEALYADPAGTLLETAGRLGLKWDAAGVRDAVDRNQPFQDASQPNAKLVQDEQTVIPVRGEMAARSGSMVKDPAGFIRKARPGGWREDLSVWEKFEFWRIARKTLADMGYEW